MGNRRLTAAELETANRILDGVRSLIRVEAGTDDALLWALRRKICKELGYDERGKPMQRKNLKFKKWKNNWVFAPNAGEHFPKLVPYLIELKRCGAMSKEIHDRCARRAM